VIISFPTALYHPNLPTDDESGNVTFLISSEDPPRPQTSTLQLFRGEEIKPLPHRIFTDEDRLKVLGELVATVSSGATISVGLGKKAFEVGQLLEFNEVEDETAEPTTNLSPDGIDLQHNTNILDLESAGLSETDIDQLLASAKTRFDALIIEFKGLQSTIKELRIKIDGNQRLINEVRKANTATRTAFSIGASDSNAILDKLEQREAELLIERDELINAFNTANEESILAYNELVELKEVVR
jgi:hypothetical protein